MNVTNAHEECITLWYIQGMLTVDNDILITSENSIPSIFASIWLNTVHRFYVALKYIIVFNELFLILSSNWHIFMEG